MSYDPMRDPREDEAQAKREIDREEREQRLAVEDLKWMAAHLSGRRVLWRLMARTGVFRNPFHTSGSVMAFKAGEQNVGQEILAQLMEHAPDAFTKMMKESAEEERRALDRTDNTQGREQNSSR